MRDLRSDGSEYSDSSSLDSWPLRQRSVSLKNMDELERSAEFDSRPSHALGRKKSLHDMVLEAEDRDLTARIDNDIISGRFKSPTPLQRKPSTPSDLRPHFQNASVKDIIVNAEERDLRAEREVVQLYLKSCELADKAPNSQSKNPNGIESLKKNSDRVLPALSRSLSLKEVVKEAEERDARARSAGESTATLPRDLSRVHERKQSVKDLVVQGEIRDYKAEEEDSVVRPRHNSIGSRSEFSSVFAKPFQPNANIHQAELTSVEVYDGDRGYEIVHDVSTGMERKRSLQDMVMDAEDHHNIVKIDAEMVNRKINMGRRKSSLQDLLKDIETDPSFSPKKSGDCKNYQVVYAEPFIERKSSNRNLARLLDTPYEDVNNNQEKDEIQKADDVHMDISSNNLGTVGEVEDGLVSDAPLKHSQTFDLQASPGSHYNELNLHVDDFRDAAEAEDTKCKFALSHDRRSSDRNNVDQQLVNPHIKSVSADEDKPSAHISILQNLYIASPDPLESSGNTSTVNQLGSFANSRCTTENTFVPLSNASKSALNTSLENDNINLDGQAEAKKTEEKPEVADGTDFSMSAFGDDDDGVFDVSGEADLRLYRKYLERSDDDDGDSSSDLGLTFKDPEKSGDSTEIWISDEMKQLRQIVKRKRSIGDLITETELRPMSTLSSSMSDVPKMDQKRLQQRKASVRDIVQSTERQASRPSSSLSKTSDVSSFSAVVDRDLGPMVQRRSSVRDLTNTYESGELETKIDKKDSKQSVDMAHSSGRRYSIPSYVSEKTSLRELVYYADYHGFHDDHNEKSKIRGSSVSSHRREIARLSRSRSVTSQIGTDNSTLRDLVHEVDKYGKPKTKGRKLSLSKTTPELRELRRLKSLSSITCANEECDLRELINQVDAEGSQTFSTTSQTTAEQRELRHLWSTSSISCSNDLGDLKELIRDLDNEKESRKPERKTSSPMKTLERVEIDQLRKMSLVTSEDVAGDHVNLRELVWDVDDDEVNKPKKERGLSACQVSPERAQLRRLRKMSLVNEPEKTRIFEEGDGDSTKQMQRNSLSKEKLEIERLRKMSLVAGQTQWDEKEENLAPASQQESVVCNKPLQDNVLSVSHFSTEPCVRESIERTIADSGLDVSEPLPKHTEDSADPWLANNLSSLSNNQQERVEDREGGFPAHYNRHPRGQEVPADQTRSKSTSNLKVDPMEAHQPQGPRPAMSASTLPRNYQQRQPEYVNRPGPQDPRHLYANHPGPHDQQRDYVNRPGPQDMRDPRDPRNQPTYQNYPPADNRYGAPAHLRQPEHGRSSPYQQTQTLQDTVSATRHQDQQYQPRPQEPARHEPVRQPSSSSLRDRPRSTHDVAPNSTNEIDRHSRPQSEFYDRSGGRRPSQTDRYDQRPSQSPYGREGDIPRSEANNQQYQQHFYQNAPVRTREVTPPFDQMRRPQEDRPRVPPSVAPKPSVLPKPDKPRVAPQEIPREDIDNRQTQQPFFDPSARHDAPRSPYHPSGSHPGHYPDDRYRATPPRQEHLYDTAARTNGSPELPPPPPELAPPSQPEDNPAEELPPPPPPPVHDYVNYDHQGRIVSSEPPRSDQQWQQQYPQYGGPQSRDQRPSYSVGHPQSGPQPQEPFRPQNSSRLESQRGAVTPPWQTPGQKYPGQPQPPQQLSINTRPTGGQPTPDKQMSPSPWEKEEKERQKMALESQETAVRNQLIDELQSKPYLSPDEQERLRRLRLDQEFQRRVEEVKARGSDDEVVESDEEMTERAKGRTALLHMMTEDLERSKQRLAESDAQRKRDEEQGERERQQTQDRILQQLEQQRNEEKMRNQMRQEKKQREHEEWLRKQRAAGAKPEERPRLPSSEKERLRQRLEEHINYSGRAYSPPPDNNRLQQAQELREKQRREQEEHKRIEMREEEKLRTRREEEVRLKREQERQQLREMEAVRDAEERAIREDMRRKEEQSRQLYQYHTYQNIDNKGSIAPPPPERKSSYDLVNQHGYRAGPTSPSSSTLPRPDPSKKSVSFNAAVDPDSAVYNNVPPTGQQPGQPQPYNYMATNNNNTDSRYEFKGQSAPPPGPQTAPSKDRFESPSSQQVNVQYTTSSTPGVIGAQEIYRDPRMRIEARRRSENKPEQVEKMSFKDKMKLFAQEAGEGTPKERPKSSSLQRAIEYSLNGQ